MRILKQEKQCCSIVNIVIAEEVWRGQIAKRGLVFIKIMTAFGTP